MMILAILLSSAAVSVTWATDISERLNERHLADPLYIFDVTSNAPLPALKAAIGREAIRHSFKVIGEKRYLFVVHEITVDTLRQLDFPEGSLVKQIPVEHIQDFLAMFDAGDGWKEDDVDVFHDKIISMTTWEFDLPEGTTTEEYGTMLKNHFAAFVNTHSKLETVVFAEVAAYPAKIYYFGMLEPNALQHVVKDNLDTTGGPANNRVFVKHVVKV